MPKLIINNLCNLLFILIDSSEIKVIQYIYFSFGSEYSKHVTSDAGQLTLLSEKKHMNLEQVFYMWKKRGSICSFIVGFECPDYYTNNATFDLPDIADIATNNV